MNDLWNYLTTSANWHDNGGDTGLWTDIVQHLTYSFIAVLIAAVVAFPVGMAIGHTGRGRAVVVGAVNASRALPTFGLIVLLYVILSPHFHGHSNTVFILPVEIVLVLLAIPPILSNTYAGIQQVEPAIKDAAKGMGMTGGQVLLRVELPNALPLIISGLRSAILQVIATATVGAYIGLGGLGHPIYNGFQSGPFQDTPDSHTATGQLLAGAVLVALLALVVDLIVATIQRYVTSRGITARYKRSHLRAPVVAVP
ncbi:osmoprotectant transport system permease protein [Nakamurella panacisegetis]|uniref:Osmoprotectant transport system permease protein n=1 Tax=Nakamurella panacisegetis TaxID=1090615 RepID=A0A1H0NVM4_9ACTN|nr:ABC transporter permease [Nakamurella panacisegetis]SDO96807.1 osmoprotectant transport system permease protein [Nakamurella panacisegetis]